MVVREFVAGQARMEFRGANAPSDLFKFPVFIVVFILGFERNLFSVSRERCKTCEAVSLGPLASDFAFQR
jgi:hypothetical protein